MNRLMNLCLVLCLFGCSTKAPKNVAMSVLFDITDKDLNRPHGADIRSFFSLEEDMWNGVTLQMKAIADVEYGIEKTFSLAPENSWFSNELERKKEVEEFLMKVDTVFSMPTNSSKKYSVIYPVIIRELNRLTELDNDCRKVMLIYSDLLENTDRISFVRHPNTMTNPNSAWKKLENSYRTKLTDDLTGIEVYIIYKAKNLTASHTFSNITTVYREQLLQRGAKVTIKSSL